MFRKKPDIPAPSELYGEHTLMRVSAAFHFAVGAVGYPLLELWWRGRTHPSMALAGGAVMLYASLLAYRPMRRFERSILITLFTLFVELLLGVIFNIWLGCNVWDYSRFRLHLFGQICPVYAALWFLLSFPVAFFTQKSTAVLRHLLLRRQQTKKAGM